MGSTRPNPTHVGWVGSGWTYVMGWVGLNFFFDPPWWVESKNPLNPTQPDPCTPLLQMIYFLGRLLRLFLINDIHLCKLHLCLVCDSKQSLGGEA